MKKLILLILLIIALLLPNSPVLAKEVDRCANTDTLGPPLGIGSLTTSGKVECPDEADCFKQTPDLTCYKRSASGPGMPGTGPAIGATIPTKPACKADDKTCSTGRGVPCREGISTAIGCVPTEPRLLVETLLKVATLASGGIAFLLMILASLEMITAEGSAEVIKKAQEKFYSAIIGLLLIIFSVLLMQVIGVDILGLPGFGPLK